MTLDATLFHETKTFVKPHPQALYPVNIPLSHYQLRHFISAVEDGRIYYAAQHEVFALHLATGKRDRLATLPFPAQCLGAGCGWVCVGGQTGRCVFIDVRERSARVDELLPLNLDPHARPGDEPRHDNPYRLIRPKTHPHNVSTDYINSIAVFRLAADEMGMEDEEVALISTNDHSVEIFSLSQLKVITSLTFPVDMNHASLSPDGKLMVACGDTHRAYFLRRVRLPGHSADGSLCYAKYEWKEFAQVELTHTEPGDPCFSTAFSPSGHVCSVSSQFGVVTVFDVNRIRAGMEDDDAVIDSFTSSRPAALEDGTAYMPGAVRSSAFSPEPWDLFAWAEDRGRVCIADLRDGFRTRQLIELDPHCPDVKRHDILEAEDQSAELRELEIQASLLRRHRDTLAAHDHQLAALQQSADYVENAAERRRRQRELSGNVWTTSTPPDLNEAERQILETLRVERLQDAANSQADERAPFSVYYPGQNDPPSRGYNPNMSVRQYIRERSAANRDHPASRTHGPRRRSSIVISGARSQGEGTDAASASALPAAHPSSLVPITGTNALSASPSRLANTTSAQSSTPSSGRSSPDIMLPIQAANAFRRSSTITSAAQPPVSASGPNDPRDSPAEAARRLGLEESSTMPSANVTTERQQQVHQRERERDETRAQVLSLSGTDPERETRSTITPAPAATAPSGSALTPAPAAPAPGISDNSEMLALLRLQRERTRRQQVEQLLAEYRALQRQGWETQERAANARDGLGRAERGLDRVHLQQLRRLHERAQLAEERLPGVAAAAAISAAAVDDVAALSGAGGTRYRRSSDTARRRAAGEPGVAIMGLAWSNDGRTLFVGTEDGILLYQLDTHARKCFPAVQPR